MAGYIPKVGDIIDTKNGAWGYCEVTGYSDSFVYAKFLNLHTKYEPQSIEIGECGGFPLEHVELVEPTSILFEVGDYLSYPDVSDKATALFEVVKSDEEHFVAVEYLSRREIMYHQSTPLLVKLDTKKTKQLMANNATRLREKAEKFKEEYVKAHNAWVDALEHIHNVILSEAEQAS